MATFADKGGGQYVFRCVFVHIYIVLCMLVIDFWIESGLQVLAVNEFQALLDDIYFFFSFNNNLFVLSFISSVVNVGKKEQLCCNSSAIGELG